MMVPVAGSWMHGVAAGQALLSGALWLALRFQLCSGFWRTGIRRNIAMDRLLVLAALLLVLEGLLVLAAARRLLVIRPDDVQEPISLLASALLPWIFGGRRRPSGQLRLVHG